MSDTTLRLSDLAKLTAEEKEKRLSAFAASRSEPINGEVEFLDDRIAAFEKRYEMSSTVMKDRVSGGFQSETADIGAWLILLDIKARLRSATPSR